MERENKDNEVYVKIKAQHANQLNEWYSNSVMEKWVVPKNATTNPELGANIRMHKIQQLKGSTPYNTMDMIVVILKLYDYLLQKETIYGTLFCEIIDSVGKARRSFFSINGEEIHGNVVFTYYSASPSFISCDGEYRLNFSKYKYLIITKKLYSEIWNEIHAWISDKSPKRSWSLSVGYFYPKLKEELKNTEVEFAVKNEGVSKDILCVTWFQNFYYVVAGMDRSNINENFHQIFSNKYDEDLKFMKDLIKKYGATKIEEFNVSLFYSRNSKMTRRDFSNPVICGWKMIPLNVKEVQDPLQLRYKPWREWYVTNRFGDMVVNSVAPGFPVILDWFYIKNSRPGLYDNKSQFDRMRHSDIAKDILHTLYEAQRGTYFATENIETKENDFRQWISSKFKRLSEKIDEPINYSIEEIIMSEVTLAFVGEYLGRTFSDIIKMHKKALQYDEMIGHPFDPRGYKFFAKYIFEVCYNLYCSHSRFFTIHCDLHLNNATIGELYNVENSDMYVSYNVDDKTYAFNNNGFFGCLIDFSRCIIHPEYTHLFIDKQLPSNYKIVANQEKFRSEELMNLLNLYIKMFPNKAQKREELILLFKTKFDAIFKLLSAVDLFMFSVRLFRLMKQEGVKSKTALNLVQNIEKMTEYYLSHEMNNLIENPNYSTEIDKMDWPAAGIIKKFFSEFETKNIKQKLVIIDHYDSNAKITSSLDKFDLFPEFMRKVKYEEKGKLIEVPVVEQYRKAYRIEQEELRLKNLDMLKYIAERHRQKLA